MNNFEIKKGGRESDIPFTYESIIFDGSKLIIEIKIPVNCNNISFVHDDVNPTNRKYKVEKPHHIIIEGNLSISNYNYLKYCYDRNANAGGGECILKFEIPKTSLTPFNGKYTLKFEGDNKNESTKLYANRKGGSIHPPPIETEEGIIIFEPPT